MSEQNTQYEKTLNKGISLLTNNPNAIIDIIQVANRLIYLRGRLYEQSQQKKDKDDGLNVSLSGNPKQLQRKNNKDKHMSASVDKHVDNPQDDPRQTSGVAKGDTGDCTFPADFTQRERLNYYKRQKERSPTNYGRIYWDGRIDELKLRDSKYD